MAKTTDGLPANPGATPSKKDQDAEKKTADKANEALGEQHVEGAAGVGATDELENKELNDALDTSGNSPTVNRIVNPEGGAQMPNNVDRAPLSTPGASSERIASAGQIRDGNDQDKARDPTLADHLDASEDAAERATTGRDNDPFPLGKSDPGLVTSRQSIGGTRETLAGIAGDSGTNPNAPGVQSPEARQLAADEQAKKNQDGPPDDKVKLAEKEEPERTLEGDAIADETGDVDVKDETDDYKIKPESVKSFADQIIKDLAATVTGMKLSKEEGERARRAATVVAYCTIASIGAPESERQHLAQRIKGANTTLLNQLVGKNVEIRKAARDQLYRTVRAVIGKVIETITMATAAV